MIPEGQRFKSSPRNLYPSRCNTRSHTIAAMQLAAVIGLAGIGFATNIVAFGRRPTAVTDSGRCMRWRGFWGNSAAGLP